MSIYLPDSVIIAIDNYGNFISKKNGGGKLEDEY